MKKCVLCIRPQDEYFWLFSTTYNATRQAQKKLITETTQSLTYMFQHCLECIMRV